jgi:hypothetical protein
VSAFSCAHGVTEDEANCELKGVNSMISECLTRVEVLLEVPAVVSLSHTHVRTSTLLYLLVTGYVDTAHYDTIRVLSE